MGLEKNTPSACSFVMMQTVCLSHTFFKVVWTDDSITDIRNKKFLHDYKSITMASLHIPASIALGRSSGSEHSKQNNKLRILSDI